MGGGSISSRIPAARGGKLLESERRLLLVEVDLDKGDLFPRSRKPTSLAPTRAPMLDAAHEQYVEIAITRRFKKLSAVAAEQEEQRRQLEAASTPGAGPQVCMYVCCNIRQRRARTYAHASAPA